MTSRSEKVAAFRALHRDGCFVMPNPWDVGSARVLEARGFRALATTSSGYAFTQGKPDGAGAVTRDEALAHAEAVAAHTRVPVNGDFENGYADDPAGVAETVRLAAEAGLAGVSVEDRMLGEGDAFYGFEAALARVAAAAEAARRHEIVLTARADGLLSGAYGFEEALARLKAFAGAGADVVYAPGVPDLPSLVRLCAEAGAPVNYLLGAGPPMTRAEVFGAGVRRISLGGTLARATWAALSDLGRELLEGDFAGMYAAPSWAVLTGEA